MKSCIVSKKNKSSKTKKIAKKVEFFEKQIEKMIFQTFVLYFPPFFVVSHILGFVFGLISAVLFGKMRGFHEKSEMTWDFYFVVATLGSLLGMFLSPFVFLKYCELFNIQ